eukprot:jgi/Tetstr1/438099/TSEL_026722.t1
MADGKVDTDLGNSALRGGETSALASAVAGGARFPSRLVGMEEAPAYMHRPGISHGYRIGGGYVESALRTLFSPSNETMNAWTMVIGGAVTTAVFLWTSSGIEGLPQQLPFILCWLSSLVHIPFSVCLHCFCGISERVRSLWRTLDVSVLMATIKLRALSVSSLILKNTRTLYYLYAACTIFNYAVFLREFFSRNKRNALDRGRHARLLLISGITACIPLLYSGLEEYASSGAVGPLGRNVLAMLALGSVGALIFGKGFPERLFPGRVTSYWLHSHQFMHIFVMAIPIFEFKLLFALSNEGA